MNTNLFLVVLFSVLFRVFAAQNHESQVLFDPTKDKTTISYHSFRIPSIVRAKQSNVLIAIAEGRQCSSVDYGNINLVYKRSTNNGKTWSAMKDLVGVGDGTWGNPTPVVDERGNGTIYLFVSWNSGKTAQYANEYHPCTNEPLTTFDKGDRKVFLIKSIDHGVSWLPHVDMTSTLQPDDFKFDAMGPGNGIQLSYPPYSMVIPATNRNIFFANGRWQYKMIPTGSSEGTITELSEGVLLRNDRVVKTLWLSNKSRFLSRGTLEGTFSSFQPHAGLVDPRCQGSSMVYTLSNPHRLLFLNPARTDKRCQFTIRVSYDDGITWPISRLLHDNMTAAQTCLWPRRGGYSSMAKTHDFHVGIMTERNSTAGPSGRGYIEFHRVNLAWILNGATEPSNPPSPFTRANSNGAAPANPAPKPGSRATPGSTPSSPHATERGAPTTEPSSAEPNDSSTPSVVVASSSPSSSHQQPSVSTPSTTSPAVMAPVFSAAATPHASWCTTALAAIALLAVSLPLH